MSYAIFLSPHFDDACFSLGGLIANHPGSTLLNIFTKSLFLAAPDSSYEDSRKMDPVERVYKIRNAEDDCFAKKMSLRKLNLNLEDTSAVGLHPFDLANISKEVALVSHSLIHHLNGIYKAANSQRLNIFCPLSVGNHRNHVSVFLSILENYDVLSNFANIFFYEDLPYAGLNELRVPAILRLEKFFPSSRLKRNILNLSKDELDKKMEYVEIYASQDPLGLCHSLTLGDPRAVYAVESYWSAA